MIKIKERATISDEFITTIQDFALGKLRELSRMTGMTRTLEINHFGAKYANMKKIARKANADALRTSLRSLDYVAFDVLHHKDKIFLHGATKPITAQAYEYSHKLSYCFELGSFDVYIPIMIYDGLGIDDIRIIPRLPGRELYDLLMRNAESEYQYNNVGINGHTYITFEPYKMKKGFHFVDVDQNWCWGGLGGVISSTVESFSITELFRSMTVYLQRVNTRDLLYSSFIHNPWVKRIEKEG